VGDYYGTELRFGLNLGWLPLLKKKEKICADYEQILVRFFQIFMGRKKIKNTVVSALKSCIR
jgi:hypothetical protein